MSEEVKRWKVYTGAILSGSIIFQEKVNLCLINLNLICLIGCIFKNQQEVDTGMIYFYSFEVKVVSYQLPTIGVQSKYFTLVTQQPHRKLFHHLFLMMKPTIITIKWIDNNIIHICNDIDHSWAHNQDIVTRLKQSRLGWFYWSEC